MLEQGSHAVVRNRYPRLPPARDIRLEPARESIDILEYLRIGRCELQQLVAERNSSLGRLAQPSQRLVYEIRFLSAGDACLEAIGEDYPELAADLGRVLEAKRRDLPLVIWQATLGGDEFREYWQRGNDPLPETFGEAPELMLALSQLADDIEGWRAGDLAIDSSRLEHQLDVIRRGSGGKQLAAWALIDEKLAAASGVVRDRIERRALCFEGMPTPKADILDSVVREYFVGRIQRWAASLNARHYELHPRILRIERLLADVMPPAYRDWQIARDTRLEAGRGALARHVEALRPLLSQCNLLPAAPDS